MNITDVNFQEYQNTKDALGCFMMASATLAILILAVPYWFRRRASYVAPCPIRLAMFRA